MKRINKQIFYRARADMLTLTVLFAVVMRIGATTPVPTHENYGTTAAGTKLFWTSYEPNGFGFHPAVLVIHVGGFKKGHPGSLDAAQDLANAGFWALAVEYRLAPPHHPMDAAQHPDGPQVDPPDDGRPPQQTDDIKMAIVAARADHLRCNGKVLAVGGSAGGCHAAFCAAVGTPGNDKLDAAVLLSPATNLDNPVSLDDILRPNFRTDCENYLGQQVSDRLEYHTAAQAASPVNFVTSSVAPLYLLATNLDPMPPGQFRDLRDKLSRVRAINCQARLITDLPPDPVTGFTPHAFAYWPHVRDSAIAFLNLWAR